MIVEFILLFFSLIQCARSVNLYVASYSGGTWAGNITTLSLLQQPDSSYSLTQIATLNTSTNSPSWLALDRQNNVLYLVDEAVNVSTGTLVSYRTSFTGELKEIKREPALYGGVHATFFASGGGLAVPKYESSTLQTYQVSAEGDFSLLQTFNFSNPPFNFTQGPVSDRQEAPHPHEAILDPTQRYVLIPDLGADQVHVFAVDKKRTKLTPVAPLVTVPGYGPRHGAFSLDPINGNYIFYLVGELSGNLTAFKVSYDEGHGGMSFEKLATYKTLNPGESFPPNPDGQSKTAPAEIQITVSCSISLHFAGSVLRYSSPMATQLLCQIEMTRRLAQIQRMTASCRTKSASRTARLLSSLWCQPTAPSRDSLRSTRLGRSWPWGCRTVATLWF